MGSDSVSDRGLAAVSVIATVYNEGESIERLLESLAGQTRPPDEVVIVDGGSKDDTVARLQRWAASGRLPLRVLERSGANISAGRNAAIAAAHGPLIAATDAGVRLGPGWLAALLAPFARANAPAAGSGSDPGGAGSARSQGGPVVVSGFFVPDAHSAFEVALAATTLPALRDVNPGRFLPSSRSVAFRKSAWEAVGGYPEWLDYCEDLIFDLRLKEQGFTFAFAPEAVVAVRPRASLGAFYRQYYRYARGDGKADLWRRRHAIRYATYLVAVPGVAVLAAALSPWWALSYLAGAAAMFATPYRRLPDLWGNLPGGDRIVAAAWVPIIRIAGDIAKMVGYPVGWVWRRKHDATSA
jgi:GT2 family glycosyltransferase